jgi:hypothetical protein
MIGSTSSHKTIFAWYEIVLQNNIDRRAGFRCGQVIGLWQCVTALMVPRPPCALLKACTPVEESSQLRLPNTGVSPVGVDQPVGDPQTSRYIADHSRPHPQHRLLPDPTGLTVPASPVIQPPSPIAPLTLSICIPFLIPSLTPLVAHTAHSTPALIVLRLVPLASSRYICIRFPVYSDSFLTRTCSNIDCTNCT